MLRLHELSVIVNAKYEVAFIIKLLNLCSCMYKTSDNLSGRHQQSVGFFVCLYVIFVKSYVVVISVFIHQACLGFCLDVGRKNGNICSLLFEFSTKQALFLILLFLRLCMVWFIVRHLA